MEAATPYSSGSWRDSHTVTDGDGKVKTLEAEEIKCAPA